MNKISSKEKIQEDENFLTMLTSEDSLKKDWNNKLDERWNTIR